MDNGPEGRHFNVPLVTMTLSKGSALCLAWVGPWPPVLGLWAVLVLASSWVACGLGAVPRWRREETLCVSTPDRAGSDQGHAEAAEGKLRPESTACEVPVGSHKMVTEV